MNKQIKEIINNLGKNKIIISGIVLALILILFITPFRIFFKYYIWDSLHIKSEYFFKQGVKYEEKKNIDYSIGSFKRALRIKKGKFNINPQDFYQIESLFNIGVIYYQYKKDYTRALFYFNRYIDILDQFKIKNVHEKDIYKVINYILSIDDSTKNAQAKLLKNKGNKAYFKKEYANALSYYKEALTVDPSYIEVYNNIATTYFQLKDFKNAVDYWKLTLLFSPDELDIYINIALAYETQLRNYKEAIKYYEKFSDKVKPSDPKYIEAQQRIKKLNNLLEK